MYKTIKSIVSKLHSKNNILERPIPIYLIEQIIIDHNYDISIIPGLTKSCILGRTVCTVDCNDLDYRFSLAHELGHIILHTIKFNSSQSEARANAFAAYFLMPPYLFEDDFKFSNIDELSEIYGVSQTIIKYRFTLMKGKN